MKLIFIIQISLKGVIVKLEDESGDTRSIAIYDNSVGKAIRNYYNEGYKMGTHTVAHGVRRLR